MKRCVALIFLFALATAGAATKPVRVFILAGQSNMEGHGFMAADPKRNGGRGSLEFLVKDAATAQRFAPLVDSRGQWRTRDDVWISYLDRKGPLSAGFGARAGETIGPELGFGWVMGDALEEPVLLVKCAWGGKSLAVDFRPPSAGRVPYSLGEKGDAAIAADPTIVGRYYRETLALSRAALDSIRRSFPAATEAMCWPASAGIRAGTIASATASTPSMKATWRTSSATCAGTWARPRCRS